MRYTLLGRSGLRVSEFCLGTMTFGEDWGWGASTDVAAKMFHAFAERGGNFIDTANFYTDGTAERILGALVAGRRDDFVLATKYTLQTRPGQVNSAGNHRKNLVSSLEGSLRRLRTDHIDLYWVHVRDTLTPVDEVMRALDDQVRAGKVLYVGVSDWPAWEIAHANTLAELRGWTPFTGLEIQYNLIERTPERELLPMARAFDLGVVAWGSLASGLLTGKYLHGEAGRRGRLDYMCGADAHMGEGMHERAERVVPEVVSIADEGGWTPAGVALAWLRSRPGLVIPILGATTEDQFYENLASLEIELDSRHLERLEKISAIAPGFPYDFLRGPDIKNITYGSGWRNIVDRRTRSQRPLADEVPACTERGASIG